MTSTKLQRDIKEIKNDITKSLKVLDGLNSGTALKDVKHSKINLDLAILKNLKVTESRLETKLNFFEETKRLSHEILEKIQNEYESWGVEEKKQIIHFIKVTYESNKISLEPHNVTKQDLVSALSVLVKDIDGYTEKINANLKQVNEKIKEEEEKRTELQKQNLKTKLEMGDKEREKIEEEDRLFEEELDRLKLLEAELNVALLEQEGEEQIREMRSFLNGKIN